MNDEERTRIKLPPGSVKPDVEGSNGPRMLPGMAMIAIFMLFVSLANAINVIAHRDQFRVSSLYAILFVATMILLGVFGFLRLKRWGWALLLGGCFFYSLGNVMLFYQRHLPGYLLPAAFSMVFFLYLVRTEIRERVH